MGTSARLLPLLLVATVLAGCFGVPEGVVGFGDRATIRLSATDEVTGEVVLPPTETSFVVGAGASGLGVGFERSILGQRVGDAFAVHLRHDHELAARQTVTVEQPVLDMQMEHTVSADILNDTFGLGPTPGERFTFALEGLPWGFDGEVVSHEDGNATIRHLPMQIRDDAGRPLPFEVREEGGIFLVIEGGERFVVQPDRPIPLVDLEPGAYVGRGEIGMELLLGHNPEVFLPILERDIRVEVTVLDLEKGMFAQEPVNGGWGVGPSPVLVRQPVAALAEHDDHGHDGHDH